MRRFSMFLAALISVLAGLSIGVAGASQAMQLSAAGQTPQFDPGVPATFDPGVQAANPDTFFRSVSCSNDGDCTAAGYFRNATGGQEAFTQTQSGGIWATAIPATFDPGVQNSTHRSYFDSVSCASAGNCVAVGNFMNLAGGYEAFSQVQINGTWSTANPATFEPGAQWNRPGAYFTSVSCPSAGNCVAVGSYKNSSGNGNYEAFTQTLINGVWENAKPAQFGVGVQNSIQNADFSSVSCPATGNCVAAGEFRNATGDRVAFTQRLSNGIWTNAVAATFAVGIQYANPSARFNSVSCSSTGNCVAAGQFQNAIGDMEAFTQTLNNGIWVTSVPATFAPGIQNANPNAEFNAISCASAGNCVAVGKFLTANFGYEAFTQVQSNGSWATASPALFGTGDQLEYYPKAEFRSVSCASAGNCVAVGLFTNSGEYTEAFTQTLDNGHWAGATRATFGVGVQNSGPGDEFNSVSCSSIGNCVAAGGFASATGGTEGFTQSISEAFSEPAPTPSSSQTESPDAEVLATTGTITSISTFGALAVGTLAIVIGVTGLRRRP